MAKLDYNEIVEIAQELIFEFGNPITLRRAYDASQWTRNYDAVTETFMWTNNSTGASQSTEPADEVVVADGVLVGISDKLLSNSLVKQSDSELLVLDIPEPKVGDTYTVNNKNYKYIIHETVNPANTVCLFKVILRI